MHVAKKGNWEKSNFKSMDISMPSTTPRPSVKSLGSKIDYIIKQVIPQVVDWFKTLFNFEKK